MQFTAYFIFKGNKITEEQNFFFRISLFLFKSVIFPWFDMKLFVDFWKFTKIWKYLQQQEHRIVFVLIFRCAKQFYVPNMQEQSKACKKPRNQQTNIRHLMA